jgi:hypothetical protein
MFKQLNFPTTPPPLSAILSPPLPQGITQDASRLQSDPSVTFVVAGVVRALIDALSRYADDFERGAVPIGLKLFKEKIYKVRLFLSREPANRLRTFRI